MFINGEKIDKKRKYKMSVREYIQQGHDGYEALKETEHLNSPDDEVQLISIMLDFFEILKKNPDDLRKNNLLEKDFIFGYDKELKILDFLENVTQEKDGVLGLNLEVSNICNGNGNQTVNLNNKKLLFIYLFICWISLL